MEALETKLEHAAQHHDKVAGEAAQWQLELEELHHEMECQQLAWKKAAIAADADAESYRAEAKVINYMHFLK